MGESARVSKNQAIGVAIESLDVVVVEDSRPMQTLLRSMLAARHVGRIRVFDGAEPAFQSMLAERPHLVIADWRMKPASGLQLLRAMRRRGNEPLAFVPMIMISAHATRALVENAMRAGTHAFLVKPLAPAVLFKALERVVADDRPFRLAGDHWVLADAEERLQAISDGSPTRRPSRRLRPPEGMTSLPALPPPEKEDRKGRSGRRGYGAVVEEKL